MDTHLPSSWTKPKSSRTMLNHTLRLTLLHGAMPAPSFIRTPLTLQRPWSSIRPAPAPTPAPTRQHFLMMTMMEVTQMLLSSFLPAHDVLLEGRRSVAFAAGLKSWSLGLLNVKNVVDARRWGTRGVPALK